MVNIHMILKPGEIFVQLHLKCIRVHFKINQIRIVTDGIFHINQ